MKISDWLAEATKKLTKAGITTARLDCLVLLEDATGKDRGWLLAHPEANLDDLLAQGPSLRSLEKLDERIERRVRHEPLAYIRGKAEFYGRGFYVNNHVLVPRPESETMIELLKRIVLPLRYSRPDRESSQTKNSFLLDSRLRGNDGEKFTVVDVGTGSGALGITAKLELPELKVIATDVDPACLKVARQNAQRLSADVEFLEGNLLEPLLTSHFSLLTSILLANLPYVPTGFPINAAATHEPKLALFGGRDGLDVYRQLFEQLQALEQKPQLILTEALPKQHKELANIAQLAGYILQQTDDFIQMFRES